MNECLQMTDTSIENVLCSLTTFTGTRAERTTKRLIQTFRIHEYSILWRNWLARTTVNREVPGSSPGRIVVLLLRTDITQSVMRTDCKWFVSGQLW